MVDSFETSLKKGIAQALADANIARYRADGSAYLPTETGVYFEYGPQTENSAVVVNDYVVADSVAGGDSIIGIQFDFRGVNVATRDTLRDGVFGLFHSMQPGTLGGVKVIQCFRRSGTSTGKDENGRVSGTENYYFTVHRPTANRI